MMEKSLEIILIGMIIGILLGLYCKNGIALFVVLMIALWFLSKKSKVLKQYFKLFKIKDIVIVFLIAMLISYGYICFMEKQYEDIAHQMLEEENYSVKIISSPIEKEYANQYIGRVEKIGETKVSLKVYINMKKEVKVEYGECIKVKGEYKKPSGARNNKEFDYKLYLKSIGIQGSIQAKSIEKIEPSSNLFILTWINDIENIMKKQIQNKIQDKTHQNLLLGILLGKDEKLENSVKEDFQGSSLSHVLAVSGMHISYIMIGVEYILEKTKLSRKTSKIVAIFVIIFFMFLTGNTPSVQRACFMTVLSIIATLIYRKNNIYHSMVISLFLILIQNPYSILNTGLILSYSATLGIIVFYKKINKVLLKIVVGKEKEKVKKSQKIKKIEKVIQKTKNGLIEFISVSLAVQVILLPMNLLYFQNVSITFIFSNLAVSFLIGIIMLLGLLTTIPITIPIVSSVITFILECALNMLLQISSFFSKMSFSHIYVIPPSILAVCLYYMILALYLHYINIRKKESKRRFEKILLTIVENFKWAIVKRKKIIIIGMILIIIMVGIIKQIPQDLEIHFLDVGQGDCCLITTPNHKTILVDSGGSINEDEFDVGKRTVLPYLLTHKIRTIDVVFISHFDADHCNGVKALIENIWVKKIIITKQKETSKEYLEILKLIKKKNIEVQIVKQGDVIKPDKGVIFKILYPNISTNLNGLNNNSMVLKLQYKKFSVLFTGDIEKEAEQDIVNVYKENLKSTVLKVGHHGSKSSTTQELLNMVKPKIALIGVGENNKFRHPVPEVLVRLERVRFKDI